MIALSRGQATLLATLAISASLAVGLRLTATPEEHVKPLEDDAPPLFGEVSRCGVSRPSSRGALAENEGRLRAERYPYDPEDGVRAVLLLVEAQDCYLAAGSTVDADRVERLGRALRKSVQADYASARLALRQALERRRWKTVEREVDRLLAMTRHLPSDAYVERLRDTRRLAEANDHPAP